ncbi:MAG: ABC transporter ATP-binding protein [Rhabdaerophilum sp.]
MSGIEKSNPRTVSVRGGAVSVEGAKRHFGTVKALDGVSIEVAAGEFLALLGPSGSGKTTLLMTIAGFEMPDQGRIIVDGRDVTGFAPNARNLGMVFQRYALFPHMNVRDNIGFPLRMRGIAESERRNRAETALATVGLEGYGDRLPAQLSGGQQQRVALARAIVYEPPVLLMDEPLSALDKNLRERMRLEIKRLQKQLGITVIFVTHDQEEALVMADRIAVMDQGKLVQEGAPRALYERPSNAFVAGFLGETNFVDGSIEGRDGENGLIRLTNGALVAGRAPSGLAGKAKISVRPEYIAVHTRKPEGIAMEVRLQEVIFAGASTIVLADAGLAEPLNIRITSSAALDGRLPGDPLWLTWRAEDACLFAA